MSTVNLLYKQFGGLYILKTVAKRIFSPIVKITSFYIVAIENHKSAVLSSEVILINQETKTIFLKQNFICPSGFIRQLHNFLDDGSIALVVIRNENVAGWGFVQHNGSYKFANYYFKIPPKVGVLKNLFIVPKYRGQSIGKIINQARINIIEDKHTPLGFVIPSNKYAIRNLEMYGFLKQVYVKDTLWFNKFHKRKTKILKISDLAITIEKGLKNEK